MAVGEATAEMFGRGTTCTDCVMEEVQVPLLEIMVYVVDVVGEYDAVLPVPPPGSQV